MGRRKTRKLMSKHFKDKGKVSVTSFLAKFKGSVSERYERAFKKVKEADLIIGEQSESSTGQGMEIGEATILNKPLIVIAKQGSKVSGLVKSCPILKEIIFYKDINDLKSK
ncbi:hypothetical protein GF358_00985 [Candidatus Woesearchaeota archaeon]|nr:hypothetical protein [Candidatus Woesearchaeota archaeon]